MKKYGWALNQQKLMRAIGKVGEESEEAVMEAYITIGGLVRKELHTGMTDKELAEEVKTGVNIDSKGNELAPDSITNETNTETEWTEQKEEKAAKKIKKAKK